MSWLDLVLWPLLAISLLAADARWLRVAQREHYEPFRVSAIAALWSRTRYENLGMFAAAVVAYVAGFFQPAIAIATLLILLIWPLGLSWRPKSARLAWTARFKRLTVLTVIVQAVVIAVSGPQIGAVAVLLAAPAVDLSLLILRPIERKLSKHFVDDARARLARIRPTIVGITGSYGKTSTKLYCMHLLANSRTALASPGSFNNLMGLSRTVNDSLMPGTEIFVAEMGTYGPGEIRELCAVFPPVVAAITTIGEAHLERMKDRATIVAAKSEITETAAIAVLNVDVPELRALGERLSAQKQVIRCSTTDDGTADVRVVPGYGNWRVAIRGEFVAECTPPVAGHPTNLSIAVGIALALGLAPESIGRRLAGLPTALHRAEAQETADGIVVIDDTYNANPDGAAEALRTASALARDGGRIFTITPGMIELGPQQFARNKTFAAAATAQPRMILAVTGRTNRNALTSGSTSPTALRVYPSRVAATRVIMQEAHSGDVILYENDLPDHYP